ncbi:hypothetical protein [Enterovibrio nigricans]|uniref:Uncharacterized protein n=1 Tax=Enterovibrio nigricans DSM 22720 TaxID=1121868 RepID=A0A1T4V8P5_9GAMM|nr:hypothetical protein [Enterovibrio nigricans]PKF50216.1 hypothetical protein AT251_12915 [Enterovibrio nigricans]SKA61246.1 hypothetical protein SAMN02745132_03447 [Enterovibrio nigricans DSM 22720]
MRTKTLNITVTEDISDIFTEMAAEWGYRYHGNGGKAGFMSDLITAIAKEYVNKHPDPLLVDLLPKKKRYT